MSDQKPDNPILTNMVTLRDYFAGQILPTILPDCTSYKKAAEDAYDMAGEMLKVREAK